jgi:AraC-like DNA-binding protein
MQTNVVYFGESEICKVSKIDKTYINQLSYALQFIESNLSVSLKVKDIARAVNMSESQFFRSFKTEFNITPHQYLLKQKIDKSAQLLLQTNHSISVIAQEVGIEEISTFSRTFKHYYKTSPSNFRAQNADMKTKL